MDLQFRNFMKALLPLFAIAGMACALSAGSSGRTVAPAPACPETIPAEWLSPGRHPFVYCTKEELAKVRANAKVDPRTAGHLAAQRRICEKLVEMDDASLRAVVPKPGCKIVYGLGMSMEPSGGTLRWMGWDAPFKVKGGDGTVYPNGDYPDTGDGARRGGDTYYFTARANGFIFAELDERALPALADVYALTGDVRYAHAAAILLDAIATTYPTTRRGPLDYPIAKGDEDKGGRLQRPYYQVARALYNYVNAIDLIAASGELEKPSQSSGERSIKDNVIRNLLWNGGAYCLESAREDSVITNGHADYLRGAGMVGILLGERRLAEIMFDSPCDINAMLDNIDRNGFYSEVSSVYERHTAELYISIAELVEVARTAGWAGVGDVYGSKVMERFLLGCFDRREAGGHFPAIGDTDLDVLRMSPTNRIPVGKSGQNKNLESQIECAWRLAVRGRSAEVRSQASALLRNIYAGREVPLPEGRWSIYHVLPSHVEEIARQKVDPDFFDTKSVFYGAKGLAILRGGRGDLRYGAQLLFGVQNNHSHLETLTWTFFNNGMEWSMDQGYANTHWRFGWTSRSVSHQSMVVNRRSFRPKDGGGHLKAWLSTDAVQWAVAEHPDAYRSEDVKLFRRSVAQVADPKTGGLGYWLDVGLVDGGDIREDSFHLPMADVELDLNQAPTGFFSVLGDQYKGCSILPDYRLSGFKDKPFYWAPPGDGYGFLLKPRQAKSDASVRAVFSEPAFPKNSGNLFDGGMIVDFPAEKGRDYIRAESMPAPGYQVCQYLLRKDEGGGAFSVFAKLMRFRDKGGVDALDGVLSVAACEPEHGARGYLVKWRNGASDLWILGGKETGRMETFRHPGLPEVRTDALIAMLRFDAEGRLFSVMASCARSLLAGDREFASGQAMASGRVVAVDVASSPVALKVEWDVKPSDSCEGAPLITSPQGGQPATWRVKSLDGDAVVLEDLKPSYAEVVLAPVEGKAGSYRMSTTVTRFFAHGYSKAAAIGRTVFRSGVPVGRVAGISDDGFELRLENAGTPYESGAPFRAAICELGPGDAFVIPGNVLWPRR